MAILSMGWMEEEEAMVMGEIGKPVLNAYKQRLSAKNTPDREGGDNMLILVPCKRVLF
jgi:hypothetical protein